MTDDKKNPDGAEEIDWEQALSEWDKEGFAPEVAKDTSTDKPAALAGSVPRPLYRPPVPAAAAKPKVPAPPPLPPRPKAPAMPPPLPSLAHDDDDEGGQTLIASIPRELLSPDDPGPPPASRGGLGQLFGREEKHVPSVEIALDDPAPAPLAPSPAPGPANEPRPAPKLAPIVSTKTLEAFPVPLLAGRGPPPMPVPDDPFDPFADLEPRAPMSTRPADDEIDDLLANQPPSSMPDPPRAPISAPPTPPLGPTASSRETSVPAVAPEGAPLLAPEERNYDPNEETMIGGPKAFAVAKAALSALKAPSAPPIADALVSVPPAPTVSETGSIRPAPSSAPPTRTFPDEKPASQWLSDAARDAFVARAGWLEGEARALTDKVARARALLACSEILATAGDRDRARSLAVEARDLAPSLPLAHRQARALLPSPPDPDEVLEALDAEVKMSPAGPGRVHSALIAAEAMRAAGDDEGAGKRLDQAARAAGGDVRPAIARAARALGRGELTSAALRMTDASPELAPVAEALQAVLRLRGNDPAGKGAPPTEPTPNETLLRVRAALDKGDAVTAATLVGELARVPELAGGATWLAASLAAVRDVRRADAARWLRELAAKGDDEAKRTLIARTMELGDADALGEAIAAAGALSAAERVLLSALAGKPLAADDPRLDDAAALAGMGAFASAAAAISVPRGESREAIVRARDKFAAGTEASRRQVRLGRLLAAGASPTEIEGALAAFGDEPPPGGKALLLEVAVRGLRMGDVSRNLQSWTAARDAEDERAAGAIAAALVAERAGDKMRALEAYRAARVAEPTNEAAFRAIASIEQIDLVAEMNALADDLGEGPRSAIARIEAVTRGEGLLPEPTRLQLLERAHKAAPTLPIASFLAERIGRRTGDVEEVLRWIRERRTSSSDAIEAAIDGIREALLVSDREGHLAGERLREAQAARPGDVGLRDLYERMATEAIEDRAAWREQRAAESQTDARTLFLLEAAHEHEKAGDRDGALRCAEAAAAGESPLAGIVRERAELAAGHVARLADELLSVAKSAEDVAIRREAYERLAVLDATGRNDPASALLWHRSILEELPGYEPSLRHVEQYFVGEGRDEELEPIAAAIAQALRGTGPGEATSHAELAARLRLRGAEGSWEATREMVELAAGEAPSSLWSLRMLEAHCRARGDDIGLLAVTLQLLDRTSRPAEAATLLSRAGEAASRLGRFDEARTLLERAVTEDPGDVTAWGLLADVRQKSSDPRGAAEACEALARSSGVREHQLFAWYDAGRIWDDEVKDEERATVAFEAANAIDPAHEDLFERLSKLYAIRKMQPELASLMERRLEGITDPAERLAMEVKRGRVLLEVGDPDGARAAFQAALAQNPDDPGALSAFADLGVAQRDWEAAEQALVRLARLLPAQDEQRDVYSRLGELYSGPLLNLARAEVALKEVLKRAPEDVATSERLVEVYKRQNDPARAIELQQELVAKAPSPEVKRQRIVALAAIHEQTARDNRKAEQTLEAARREAPLDVVVLRALAEFYQRQQQTPAFNILLDRAGTDARRALAAGRFSTGLFELLAAAFELRGRKEAAGVTQAMLAALEGRRSELRPAGDRAFDPRLDDLLAPDVLSPAMRALLQRTGDALDAVTAIDFRAQRAAPLPPDHPLGRIAAASAQAIGLGSIQIFVSPKLGPTCVPATSSPPVLLVGEALLAHERVSIFLVLRALKLVQARAAALARTPPADLAVLVGAWLKCFNPTWQPQGVSPQSLATMGAKVQAALPRNVAPDVGVIALDVAGNLGTMSTTLGAHALSWANRVAVLAMGDPNTALDAIALAGGLQGGAPKDAKDRATFVTRAAEARDVIAFGVTDAFAEARARLGVDR